ncbi:MAG: GNAT family N-acetyltransferase [Bosea sp. (in: a-proteobacteria)]
MQIPIREATTSDLTALLDLYKHLHSDDVPLAPTKAEEAWAGLLASGLMKVFVADCEGALVSSCTMAIIPNMTRGARPYGVVENVVTNRNWRKKGLGRAVLAQAMEAAWRVGCYKVMLATGSKQPETLRFYETAGFTKGVKTFFQASAPLVHKS